MCIKYRYFREELKQRIWGQTCRGRPQGPAPLQVYELVFNNIFPINLIIYFSYFASQYGIFRVTVFRRKKNHDFCSINGLPWWFSCKESASSTEDSGLILGWKDPLKKKIATYSSIPAWEIPRTEEPGGYSLWGLERVRHDLVTKTKTKKWIMNRCLLQVVIGL